jgi:hypothetical protein
MEVQKADDSRMGGYVFVLRRGGLVEVGRVGHRHDELFEFVPPGWCACIGRS